MTDEKQTIELTKEQYKELLFMSAIANSVVGILGDMLSEGDYKKQSERMNELESYLFRSVGDFGCGEFVESDKVGGEDVFNEELYENKISPIIADFEEFAAHDNVSNKLAWRDFLREHSEKEIKEKEKKNGGYFGVELFEYEKKYWEEFDENGFDRLEIRQ
jgi:hypothetical protein